MSNGLGDSIASVTNFLGINKVADAVAKLMGAPGCGCDEKKEYLNHLFPYKTYSRTFNIVKSFTHAGVIYQRRYRVNVTKESPLFPVVILFVREGNLEEI